MASPAKFNHEKLDMLTKLVERLILTNTGCARMRRMSISDPFNPTVLCPKFVELRINAVVSV
jgi:hypothetical protein